MGMVCIPHWLGLTINGNIGDGLSHVRLKTWPIVWVLSLSPSPIVWLGAPCLVHSCLASQLIHPDQPQVRLVSWAPDQNHKDCLENIFSFPTVREGWKLMHHGWFSYWKIGTFQPPICNHHRTRHVPYTILSACVCVCPVHHSLNKSSGIRKL